MKRFAKGVALTSITLGLMSGPAMAAGIDLSQYYYVGGGFGRDGATNQPTPLKNSIKSASALFNAMDTGISSNGEKSGGLVVDGDVLGLSCTQEGCGVNVVIRKTEELPPIKFNSRVQFGGAAAEGLYQVLPADTSGRVGASVRTVANVSCRKIVTRGFPVICEIRNINIAAFTLENMVKEGGLKRAQAEYLVRAFGYR